MEREKVIELVKQAGDIGYCYCQTIMVNDRYADDWVMAFARLVEQETLERAAKHFDDRGRHIDGGWSEGWYEPQEPGEIIRNLKDNHDKE